MSKKYLGLALAISAASAAQAGNVTSSGEDLVIDTDSGIKVKVSDNRVGVIRNHCSALPAS